MTGVGKTSSPVPPSTGRTGGTAGTEQTPQATGNAPTEGADGKSTENEPERLSQRDMFEDGPVRFSTAQDPQQRRLANATSRFSGRLEDILNVDAMSMAQGQTPHQGALSDDQKSALTSATADFVADMPLGTLAPQFGDAVRSRLSGMGIQLDNINNMTLNEVGDHVGDRAGDFAGDMAKGWANDLKDNSPGAYYGLLAAGATAVGTTAYLGGSDALKSVGLKPKFKTQLFNRSVTARAEATWDKGFNDFKLGGSLEGRVGNPNQGVGQFSAGLGYSLDGQATGVLRHQLSLGNGRQPRDIDDIVPGASYGYWQTTAQFNQQGLERVDTELSLTKPTNGFSLAADAGYNFQTERSQAGVSLRYQPSSNIDFALSGSHDSAGDSQIGLGFRMRF